MNRTTTKEFYTILVIIWLAVGFICGVLYSKSRGDNTLMDAHEDVGNESHYSDRGKDTHPLRSPEGARFTEDSDDENAPTNDPFIQEKEDAYGLGVDMDQYGRPVREEVITYDE